MRAVYKIRFNIPAMGHVQNVGLFQRQGITGISDHYTLHDILNPHFGINGKASTNDALPKRYPLSLALSTVISFFISICSGTIVMIDQSSLSGKRPSASKGNAFDTTESYPVADTTALTGKSNPTGPDDYPGGSSQGASVETSLGDGTIPSHRQSVHSPNKDEDIEIHDWDGPDDPENPLATP